MEVFTWFDILFYATYKLLPLNQNTYEKMSNVSREIQADGKDTSKRINMLMKFLIENDQFRDLQTSRIDKFVKDDELRKKYSNRIHEIYSELKSIKIDERYASIYGNVLSNIISTGGQFLADNKEGADSEMNSEKSKELGQTFISSLKGISEFESDCTLESLVGFIIKNNLINVKELTNGSSDSDTYDFFDMIIHVVKRVTDVDLAEKNQYANLYNVLLSVESGELTDNDDIIDALSDAGVSELTTTFEPSRVKQSIDSFEGLFNDTDEIYKVISKRMKQQINDGVLKGKRVNDLFRCVLNPSEYDIEDKEVIKQLEKDSKYMFGNIMRYIVETINAIEKFVTNGTALYKKTIKFNNFEITTSDCINKWKSFLESEIYVNYFKNTLKNDLQNKAKEYFDKNKDDVDMLNLEIASDVVDVILKLDVVSIWNTNNATTVIKPTRSELSTLVYVKTIYQIIKMLNNIFSIQFIDDVSNFGDKYYDAACVLIYYKNMKVDESVKYNDIMFFNGGVLFEDSSYIDYFKKLYNKIQTYFEKHGGNIFTYIKDNINNFKLSDDEKPSKIKFDGTDEPENVKNMIVSKDKLADATAKLNGAQNK